MRVAVISDIHGNDVAFAAALAHIEAAQVDQIVCLGDAIQGGPQPAQVVARLRAAGIPTVMGNADDWLLTGADSGAEQIEPERQRRMDDVRDWALTQLAPADREFIAAFQPTITLDLGAGQQLLCFHGSPTSYDDVLLPSTPDAEAEALLGNSAAQLFTGGHTHLQQIRRLGARRFFNPGSIGFAYSHQQDEAGFRADPWAEYAILTADGAHFGLEFRRVPFDVDALVAAYRDGGRPHADAAIEQYRGASS
jgi:predicted phosphodiesterase